MEGRVLHQSEPATARSAATGPATGQVTGDDRLLHIGSGALTIDGWINVDIQPQPGVDLVADVTEGLGFNNVRAVYAEHFIEHLPLEQAIDFLLEVHRILGRRGWLRISTPNLEWVWKTHYLFNRSDDDKLVYTLGANRAFRGWGHEFIWSPPYLEEALASCGFRKLRWCGYGKSRKRFFRHIEQHESSPDLPGIPHVIIIEGKKGPPRPEQLERFRELALEHFLGHLD